MFLGVGKEGTKMPKTHTNTATVTALELETARSRLLWKLGFLKRILSDGATGVGVEDLCREESQHGG